MPFSNNHLLTIPLAHNVITGNCFCNNCRRLRLDVVRNEHQANLHVDLLSFLPQREEVCLDKLFESTLKMFVKAKAYRDLVSLVQDLGTLNLGQELKYNSIILLKKNLINAVFKLINVLMF